MLPALVLLVSSLKIEAQFAVKYSSSCPGSHESFMIIDNGAQVLRAPLFGPAYVWLEPGTHSVDVSHPWCTFYDVDFTMEDDGAFVAVSNLTTTDRYPVNIRHMANVDRESMFGMKSSKWMVIAVAVLIVMQVIKRLLTTQKVHDWIKNIQEEMRKAQEELQRQQEEQRRQGRR
jgi:hypothetical protein